jgi:chromosome segregation ATPase
MTMESGDLEPRVTALEEQVRDLSARVRSSEQDSAAARVLAGAADRDVSEIRSEIRDFRRATSASFNAMRQDFTDLRQDFTDLRQDFTDLRGEFGELRDHVGKGFIEMRGKFDAAAAGQQQIVDLLNTVIEQKGQNGTA